MSLQAPFQSIIGKWRLPVFKLLVYFIPQDSIPALYITTHVSVNRGFRGRAEKMAQWSLSKLIAATTDNITIGLSYSIGIHMIQ